MIDLYKKIINKALVLILISFTKLWIDSLTKMPRICDGPDVCFYRS